MARIEAYEMAYRMQTSVPDLTDFSDEPAVDVRAVRRRCTSAGHASPPTACWLDGWPNAAYGSFSCFIAAGINTFLIRISCPNSAETSIKLRPR